MRLGTQGALVCALVLLGGCVNERDEQLLAAQDALDRCDMRAAHEHFDNANAIDPASPDAALGFALTDTLLLVEDPAVTSTLRDLGFTGGIDADRLWGPDGLLERLQRDESCNSIETFVEQSIPYPPLTNDAIDGRDLLRANLTAQEVLDHVRALEPRLARLARAYEVAAAEIEGQRVEIHGRCGVGSIVVQAPELYAAAAALTFVRAVLVMHVGYDWQIPVRDLFGSDEAQVQALQRLFRLLDDGKVAESRALFRQGLELATRALSSAQAARTPVADALFDWSRLDTRFLLELRTVLEAALVSLDTNAAVDVPYVAPRLGFDLARVFRDPPNSATLSSPLWVWETDPEDPQYGWQSLDQAALEQLIRPYFTTDPFDGTDYEWSVVDRWEELELEPVFDPNDRWERAYSCE